MTMCSGFPPRREELVARRGRKGFYGEDRDTSGREKRGRGQSRLCFDVRFAVDVGGDDVALALLRHVGGGEEKHVAGDVLVLVDLQNVAGLHREAMRKNEHALHSSAFPPTRFGGSSKQARFENSSPDRSFVVLTREC